jgi:hypothetical protein
VNRERWEGIVASQSSQPASLPYNFTIDSRANLDGVLELVATFEQRARQAQDATNIQIPDVAALSSTIEELIREGERLGGGISRANPGFFGLLGRLGFWGAVEASCRLHYARHRIAHRSAALRDRRTFLGRAIGESSYIEEVLARIVPAAQWELLSVYTPVVKWQAGASRRIPEALAPHTKIVGRARRAWVQAAVPPFMPPAQVATVDAHGKPVYKTVPEKELNQEYRDRVARTCSFIALKAFKELYGLDEITISLTQSMIDPLKGRSYFGCVVSVQIDRQTMFSIHHDQVLPENALKNFPLRFSYDGNFKLNAVQPFPSPPNQLRDHSIDLDNIDPLEFEELVRDLLEKMGYHATLTKASHDGGIDVEAVNPEPIVGGKLVIQCKRYAATIGAPLVRDLFGAMNDAGASKGILITTSHFSVDAHKFAQGKPLDLIDREELEGLLRKYGSSTTSVSPGSQASALDPRTVNT